MILKVASKSTRTILIIFYKTLKALRDDLFNAIWFLFHVIYIYVKNKQVVSNKTNFLMLDLNPRPLNWKLVDSPFSQFSPGVRMLRIAGGILSMCALAQKGPLCLMPPVSQKVSHCLNVALLNYQFLFKIDCDSKINLDINHIIRLKFGMAKSESEISICVSFESNFCETKKNK